MILDTFFISSLIPFLQVNSKSLIILREYVVLVPKLNISLSNSLSL